MNFYKFNKARNWYELRSYIKLNVRPVIKSLALEHGNGAPPHHSALQLIELGWSALKGCASRQMPQIQRLNKFGSVWRLHLNISRRKRL
ncbi:hypothetical protein THRCLA_21498 [Thraustotheca clavata]|uniref:Uncharacterized protein n=1 Tax=Thraustotheca clavata TaxID=74557 RepID=A0A1V9ZVV9_9STRA|nr:hypothetical protein THRCLA_21498 [Thraustotheca clavata]